MPGLSNEAKDIEKLGEFLKDFENLERLEILPYHNLGQYKYEELGIRYDLENIGSPSQDLINKAKNILSKYLNNVFVR